MKAYRGVDDRIRMFRPMHNMARMNVSAERACLPTFDGHELIECMRRYLRLTPDDCFEDDTDSLGLIRDGHSSCSLIRLDQEWVPHCTSSSLYIRPTLIGTEPALGVSAANEVELFVILGPVGPYFATGVKPVLLKTKGI